MSSNSFNQKYVNKLNNQINTFVRRINTDLPKVLKEFKLSFSRMPGELSKLCNHAADLIQLVSREGVVMGQDVVNGELYNIPSKVQSIAEKLYNVDSEVVKLSYRYKDNDLLQAAVKHYHEFNSELKRVVNMLISAALNLIMKVDRLPKSKT